jgi:hypothetical protein
MAVPLVLADQMRHVLQDAGVWGPGPWPGSSQVLQCVCVCVCVFIGFCVLFHNLLVGFQLNSICVCLCVLYDCDSTAPIVRQNPWRV